VAVLPLTITDPFSDIAAGEGCGIVVTVKNYNGVNNQSIKIH